MDADGVLVLRPAKKSHIFSPFFQHLNPIRRANASYAGNRLLGWRPFKARPQSGGWDPLPGSSVPDDFKCPAAAGNRGRVLAIRIEA